MRNLKAFDCDGVLIDESGSYEKAVRDTVALFDNKKPATDCELRDSRAESNNDYERVFDILKRRGFFNEEHKKMIASDINMQRRTFIEHKIIPLFQGLYLGKKVNNRYTGYIDDEPWLADNELLKELSRKYPLAIVSGAPLDEIRYALIKNNAERYFSTVLGMHDGNSKTERLMKTADRHLTRKIDFCDDRPSGIKDGLRLKDKGYHIRVFGIRPPQENSEWDDILLKSGAERVFPNVNDYCRFLLNENS